MITTATLVQGSRYVTPIGIFENAHPRPVTPEERAYLERTFPSAFEFINESDQPAPTPAASTGTLAFRIPATAA
ncbi:MAG: hypothetical protein WCJ64_03455 [Rhodospirillaceae bacterium]